MDIKVIRNGQGLRPFEKEDLEKLEQLSSEQMLVVSIKQPRSPALHRLYFQILDKVYENQEYFNNKYQLRKFLEMAAGHYQKAYLPNRATGEIVEQFWPLSIAYTELGNQEFKELFNLVNQQITKNFALDPDQLIEEVASEGD